MKVKDLEEYSEAWNSHDIDKIMSFMTDDCIFETGGGTERYGTRFVGQDLVRERFIEVWTEIPDVQFVNGLHFVQDDHGCSEWTFIGTRQDGTKIEIDGCDLFTFERGKIKSKRSYIKNRV
ncbi:nuclear transport factor 2 family protein [Pseudomaricurvus alkylphenolicus]|jgi:ketosteroid isomerase-like protein|uniref:nuclear transport factor 2 family protein n=1 Tax=Pseudomaricurvus alkylphenolicus TaxID=1306991 RepID=UPI001423C45F|nr:nuclear transport factor 2 family protein [Pseudomaricurvus alkylphenolicus]NIB42840.1 nuclear transport factor 2 family protein [Pseudomaricurvus alkylphenolicus]